ncbi:hypothetical protein COBT_001391 [Conglomerata obtusa]
MNKFSEVFSNQLKYSGLNDQSALAESEKVKLNPIITINRDENDSKQIQKNQNKQNNITVQAIITFGLIVSSLCFIMNLYNNKIRSCIEFSIIVYVYIISALADFAIFFTLSICRLYRRFIKVFETYIVYSAVYRIFVLPIMIYIYSKLNNGDLKI